MTSQMDQYTRECVTTPNVLKYIDVTDYPKELTSNVSSLQLEKRRPGRRRISPTCQVIGCNADLSGLRTYYKRYNICTDHCSASSIPVSLLPPLQTSRESTQPFLTSQDHTTTAQVRFCQQCASWHSLDKFKGNRKSCINSLLKIRQRHKVKLERTMASQLEGYDQQQQEQSKQKRGKKNSSEVTDSSDEVASGKSMESKYISSVQGESHNNSSSCTQQQRKSNVQQYSACCDDDGSHEYSQHHQVLNQTDFMDGFGHAMALYTEEYTWITYLDTAAFLFGGVDGGNSSLLFMEEDSYSVGEDVPMLAVPMPSIPPPDPLQPIISLDPPLVLRGVPIDLPQGGDDHDEAHLLPPPTETAFPGWVKL